MNRTHTTLKSAIFGLSTITLCAFGSAAQAVNLVQNGDFSSTTNGPGLLTYADDPTYGPTKVTGWENKNGYTFLFAPGTADTTGSPETATKSFKLWGPGTGSNNGLAATSPVGGNFIAADGDSTYRGALRQELTGLSIGQQYNVSFWDAAAQELNNDGATTEQWQVSFGSETQFATLFQNPDHGFIPWQKESLTFTATSETQWLSFLALGTPSAHPPISLLAGVSVEAITPVPEPFTFVGTMVGLGLGARLKSKLAKKK